MDRLSVPQFASSLNGLAEVFDKKAVSPKALEMWFDTLKEFDTNRVLGQLNGWARTHGKFPAPAELWKVLNDDAASSREKISGAEKKTFAQGYERMGATPHGSACMRRIRAILESPKPTPLQHWTAVRNTPNLPPISYQFADRYFNRFAQPVIDRQPGQDDEERAA